VSLTERRSIDLHEAWLPQEHPLHRPRHGGRQRLALVCAAIFFAAPTLMLSFGVRAAEFENRPLTSFPSVSSGWATLTGLPAWAEDHLPFRDMAVRTSGGISHGIFGEPAPLPEGDGPPSPPIGPVVPVPAPAESDRIPPSAFPSVIEGKDGWLYLGSDISGACAPDRTLDQVLASITQLRDAVEDSGRRFELIVVPNKTTMVPDNLPEDYVGADCADLATDEFWRRVVPEADAIDLRPPLRDAAERKGAPVYYPADTHWSHEGGLVLTYALAEEVSPGVTRTWQIAPTGDIPWSDDISPLIGRSGERRIDTYSLAPDGKTDWTQHAVSDFRVPLEFRSTPIAGTVDTSVRMIADSFTQFASRYLAASFTDISIMHLETAGGAPKRAGTFLARGDVVVVEVAERHLVSGSSPILLQPVIDGVRAELAKQPVS